MFKLKYQDVFMRIIVTFLHVKIVIAKNKTTLQTDVLALPFYEKLQFIHRLCQRSNLAKHVIQDYILADRHL